MMKQIDGPVEERLEDLEYRITTILNLLADKANGERVNVMNELSELDKERGRFFEDFSELRTAGMLSTELDRRIARTVENAINLNRLNAGFELLSKFDAPFQALIDQTKKLEENAKDAYDMAEGMVDSAESVYDDAIDLANACERILKAWRKTSRKGDKQ